MNQKTIITNSAKETQKFASDFAKQLKPGSIICLYGELGAGKTTFVQGLARGLGISGRVISPTFVLVREHRIREQKSGIKHLYHIDLYRTENVGQIKQLGLKELFDDKNSIVIIEWAERMEGVLPKKRIQIVFEYTTSSVLRRKITIKQYE